MQSSATQFNRICNQIEADANYRPGCTGLQLLDLVMEKKSGKARYATTVQAIVLTPDIEMDGIGRLYNIMLTGYGDPFGNPDSLKEVWYANVTRLLVRYNGEVSFHLSRNSDFSKPLPNLSLSNVLNNRCLFNEEGRKGLTLNPLSKDPTSKFYAICNQIESDSNYRPDNTAAQLMNLVMENGTTRYIPRRNAMMLKRTDDSCDFGRLYNFVATYCAGGNWGIGVIKLLVKYNGSVSFHDIKDHTFSNPSTDLSLDKVLGNRCLFTAEGREGLTLNTSLSK